MELKHDCVRDLLLTLEDNLKLNSTLSTSEITALPTMKDYSPADVVYTINKLNEAGFIKSHSYMGGGLDVSDITYYGHQFLDNIRDPDIWAKTKDTAAKVKGASLSILGEVAVSYIKQKLGLS
ncbi:DUF2513 domain-containing protein [Bacillus sp. FSL K6-1284]|uniref:DUF2513 domain-containing protein n=1 Tax=Bacillus sp. FSL K6-1284 TaxID=2921468 RepID=UPI0030FA191B